LIRVPFAFPGAPAPMRLFGRARTIELPVSALSWSERRPKPATRRGSGGGSCRRLPARPCRSLN